MTDCGLIENVCDEQPCCSDVATNGTSGMPVACPAASTQLVMSETLLRKMAAVPIIAKSWLQALMTALRVSVGFRWESMKSTTTLRPARPLPPALLLM